MPKRSKSSSRWLQEHASDPYVKQAKAEGYRSRAAYKLIEIQEKDQLLKPGMLVLELGAAPGSWTEVILKLTHGKARVIATDRLAMAPLAGVTFIQGDFTEDAVLAELLAALESEQVDVVLSDMAPNTSGIKAVDIPKMMYLAELALDMAFKVLKPGGSFLVKLFQGEGFDPYLQTLRGQFDKVVIRKPKASRARSKELYLLATGFKSMI